ncbi:hypothetical protein TNCV_878361 [Trichonephila clavipes]|nr:hypothetical protein TNCV_878361 [Trichonephila clavipes]
MADLKDLKGALVFAMKFEAAQQATRKDRHPIRAVNESDTSNSSVERLERQMRSFMNRVESLMSQKADGKKTLKCWTCGREGHLQRSCRARQGAETNSASQKEVSEKLINGHFVGRRLPDFGKPHFQVCQISTKSTGENGIFIMGHTHVNELPCNMIIDTGANVSIIRNDLAQKLKEKLIWAPPRVVLQTVTGEKIDIHGKLKVKIKFGDTTYQHAVYVADIADPFILGLDFLKEHGFTLDFNKNELRSIHEEVTIFKIEHMTESIRQKSSAERLIQEFEDVFSRNSSDIGHTTVTQHRIDTADHPPIKQHPRRLPFAKQEEVGTLLREMQENDIIEPSSSPWASQSSWFKDSYPLPRIDDTLDTLSGLKWFSTLDLKSGYWQVEIHPEDREKTAFTSGQGLWQFKVMPFGLCNAPATFERLMETVLKGLTFEACLIYPDDVIIGGRTFEEHLQNIRKVLSKLRDANLKLNPSKCKFFQNKVNYLGHIISAEGVRTDPEKVSAVKNGNALKTSLKEALTSSPILIYPQPDKPFILDTDASNESVGAVLSQEIDGQERVVAYWSKCLSKPERNYCVTRKELLAIVKAIEHFHHYLYGQKFLLRTDHASLTWLMNFRNTEGQVARWIQRLNEYYFDIRHRKGSSHGNADALSRRPCPENCRHCSRVETKYDYAIRQITTSTATPPDPWVTRKFEKTRWRILILNPLESLWSLPAINQVGRTSRLIVLQLSSIGPSGILYISGMVFYTENSNQRMERHSARKGPKIRSRGKLHRYNVGAPFERIAFDILGPLPRTASGNKYLLVVMDYFTKWPEVYPIPDQEAPTVAEAIVQHWISRYGVPLQLHSDQGRNFVSAVLKGVCELLGIDKTKTTPLHPQSDGMVERFNRIILNNLSLMVSKNQQDWDQKVPLFLLAYRSAVHETTGYSPSQMLFGQDLRLPCDLLFGRPPDTPSSPEEYVQNLQARFEDVHNLARERINLRTEKIKTRYDTKATGHQFKEGDKVWLYNPTRRKGLSPKLQSHWDGSYTILKIINDVVIRIRKSTNSKPRVVHYDRLAPYYGHNS